MSAAAWAACVAAGIVCGVSAYVLTLRYDEWHEQERRAEYDRLGRDIAETLARVQHEAWCRRYELRQGHRPTFNEGLDNWRESAVRNGLREWGPLRSVPDEGGDV